MPEVGRDTAESPLGFAMVAIYICWRADLQRSPSRKTKKESGQGPVVEGMPSFALYEASRNRSIG